MDLKTWHEVKMKVLGSPDGIREAWRDNQCANELVGWGVYLAELTGKSLDLLRQMGLRIDDLERQIQNDGESSTSSEARRLQMHLTESWIKLHEHLIEMHGVCIVQRDIEAPPPRE